MPLPANHFMDWIQGQLVGYAEMNELGEVALDTIGSLADIFFGSGSMNGAQYPLTVVPNGGTTVLIGGSSTGSQQCVIGRRICNEIAPVTLSLAANGGGSPRTDLIVGQPAEVDGYAFTTTVRNPDRTINPAATGHKHIQTANFEVVQGPGATVPSGWVSIASVVVPASSGPIVSGGITMTLPTINSILAGLSVTAFNSQTGNITLQNNDGSITIVPGGAGVFIISAAAAAASVSLINGLSGAVIIRCQDGSIGVTVSGQYINLTNNGVRSLSSPDSSVAIGGSGGVLTLASTTIWVYNSGTGGWTQKVGQIFTGSTTISGVPSAGETVITILPGFTIVSADATLQDGSLANSIVFAIQSIMNPGGGSGSYVTFSGRYTNGSSPIPAGTGVGFYFKIIAY